LEVEMRLEDVIASLSVAAAPCRKLDAQIVAVLFAPPGWVLGPDWDEDGWEIQEAPDASGQAATWMCAAGVPHLTRDLDACNGLLRATGRVDAAAIAVRALREVTAEAGMLPPVEFGGWLARRVLLELLLTVRRERLVQAA
jgi:hypothetical protein